MSDPIVPVVPPDLITAPVLPPVPPVVETVPVAGISSEFTAAEKKIYDEFESASRAVFDKAKAEAAAIGVDLKKIIGPFEAEAVKVEQTVVKAAQTVASTAMRWWEYLLHLLDFLDDPKGKFSYKRGSGVAALVTSIIFAFKGDWILSLMYFAGTVAIAIVCGLTKT